MTETTNYKFKKPLEGDYYDITKYCDTLDELDGALTSFRDGKADKTQLNNVTATGLKGIIWEGDEIETFVFYTDTGFAARDFYLIIDGYYEYFTDRHDFYEKRNGTVMLGFHANRWQTSYSYIGMLPDQPYSLIGVSVAGGQVTIYPKVNVYNNYSYHVTKVALLNIK